jgi:hypothetical protein
MEREGCAMDSGRAQAMCIWSAGNGGLSILEPLDRQATAESDLERRCRHIHAVAAMYDPVEQAVNLCVIECAMARGLKVEGAAEETGSHLQGDVCGRRGGRAVYRLCALSAGCVPVSRSYPSFAVFHLACQ